MKMEKREREGNSKTHMNNKYWAIYQANLIDVLVNVEPKCPFDWIQYS